ncbi:retrovirus-related pol polyprotein from transposon TNT 1-94 [Tanacetum coccineum]
MFESRQTTILFPSRLNNYYCEEKKGSYGPQFSKAYSYEASHIDKSIPQKEKDPGNRTVKYPKGIAENVLVGIGEFVFLVDFIILDMPEDVKVPLILGRPFLSTAHAKINVFKRKITLRVRDEKIIFKSVKPASTLIKRVYMLSLRERMELDLEARLMRDQVDDLMPIVEEGKVIDEPMIDIIKTRNNESFDQYPSFYDFDRKIHIDLIENMDGYRDQDMGDIILGEPFYKASCVEEKRFDGLVTIHNGSDNVTYQMA